MSKDTLISSNSFTDGMNQDSLSSLTDFKTYNYALNAVKSSRDSKGFGLTNEGGTKLIGEVPGNVVGTKYCEERNWTIIFTEDDSLYFMNHANGEIKKIMSASEFGCDFGFDECEWVGGNTHFKTMDPCNQLYVYFSAGCNLYRINIDQMLDPDRKAGLVKELGCQTKCGMEDNCEYFRIFKQACAPKLTPKSFDNGGGGGALKAGAYTFVTRFLHTDGGETNWFHFSDPVFIGSEHNIAGEDTSSYIEISMSGLDCKFASIELAVIENIGGIITAKTLNNFHYNSDHYSYRYNGTDGVPINIKELLVKSNIFLQARYMEQKDGHMLYYGVKSRKNLHYQPKANGIQAEYVVYQMPFEHVKKYNVRSFMRGETYAFGIVWNYKDGSHSSTFTIPGSPSGVGTIADQTSSVSENFLEQPNSNAELQSGAGTSSTSSASSSASSLSSTRTVCEYEDVISGLDVNYDAKVVSGDYDTLELMIIGDSTKTDILKCIRRYVVKGFNVTVLITDHDDTNVDFEIKTVEDLQPSSLKLTGRTSLAKLGEARYIAVLIEEASSEGGSGGSFGGSYSSSQDQCGSTTASITVPQEVERKRSPIPDSVSNPQHDDYDDLLEEVINDVTTDLTSDFCEEVLLWEEHLKAQCCACSEGDITCEENLPAECGEGGAYVCCGSGDKCEGGKAYEQCLEDIGDEEKSFARWGNLLEMFTEDKLDNVGGASISSESDTLKDASSKLIIACQKRERLQRKKRQYNISKSVGYSGGSNAEDTSTFSGPLFDAEGNNETEVDIVEISAGRTQPDFESDIIYPCSTDCNGDFIYGDLAGTPVSHHKFPDSNKEPHFTSKAVGVPYGKYFPDAGETSDLYINIMGVRFSGIERPDDTQLPIPLCPNNPYSIVMVKRTDSNRKVVIKGLATGTFTISNNGKDYDHPRYGLNSRETVSYYHDDGNGGRLSGGGSGSSHTLYSLDGACMQPSLHADSVVEELRLNGQGERYGLYAKGKEPDDAIKGSRVDAAGARQSINLHEWSGSGAESDLAFKKYARGNEAIAPGAGGTRPLENRSQQPCIWFESGLSQLTDSSFTGDVLEHNVPIPDAQGQYVSFRRKLSNQYGSLENLNYIPLLHAGKNHGDTIEGPVGDVYIGPYSFIKTGFVSDKVGSCDPADRFNIPAQVPTKEEKRCICDGPEDVIHQFNGAWVWTELPEDGDAADPKNWAGTHTHSLNHTDTYEEAVGSAPVSDFYYPGTTTTLITYVGEFETNPWLREKSAILDKQWYPEIKKPAFNFDSGISVDANVSGWEDCYLNQFHREIEQPSLWKKLFKTILRTTLNTLGPLYGLDRLLDIDNGGIDLVGNLAEFPMIAVIWYILVQVLFKNDFIDKLLGIPRCKEDTLNGFPEGYNKGLFFNPTGYNVDYSTVSDLYTYEGMPDEYHVCDCDECFDKSGELSNEIYISDRQQLGSIFDSYTHVRPLSKIHISASFGKLTNLFSVAGQLYAHTTDAIIPIRRSRAVVTSDLGELLLGAQGFLLEPEGIITEGITEGFSGLRRHNEQINTQYGYFFVDSEADVIYRFQGQGGLQQISSNGMYNFFKEKLNFCNPTECIDNRVKGTSYYALGVDPRHNRFLITKSESNANYNFTLSYDLEQNTWASFHSYIPRAYIWDRRDLYSLYDNSIWRHNEDCIYQTYYGTYYPHEIEFTSTSQDIDTFVWQNMVLNTEAEKCSGCSWIEDLDVTFNKIAFWNSTQGTGTQVLRWVSDDRGKNEDMRKLIEENVGVIRAHKKRRFWRINEIKDFRTGDCSEHPMTTCEKCQPIHNINEGIFDCSSLNKQNFRNKVIADKYCKYRLIYDYDDTTKINTIYVNSFGKPNEI